MRVKSSIILAVLLLSIVFFWYKERSLRESIQKNNQQLALFEKKIEEIVLLKKRWNKKNVQKRVKTLVKRFRELRLVQQKKKWVVESASLSLKKADKVVNTFLNSYVPIERIVINREKDSIYLKMELKI